MLLCYQIKPNGKIMTDKAPKIVHTYFNPEHISEIDDYVNEQKKLGRKNSEGRAYSRNDYFVEAMADYAKKLGLRTTPKNKKN